MKKTMSMTEFRNNIFTVISEMKKGEKIVLLRKSKVVGTFTKVD